MYTSAAIQFMGIAISIKNRLETSSHLGGRTIAASGNIKLCYIFTNTYTYIYTQHIPNTHIIKRSCSCGWFDVNLM